MKNRIIFIAMCLTMCLAASTRAKDGADPFIWLEDIDGQRALAWVKQRNLHSMERLQSDRRFTSLQRRALDDYNADDKIPYGTIMGDEVHNIWRDARHIRGLWRKTSLADYRKAADNWRTVLDFDKLARDEDENWVYQGRDCLAPGYDRCLLRLSRGGGDAVVIREYDAREGRFVEDGFNSPQSKQWAAWVDADTLMIATDFGSGSMNSSGYPRQVRLWQRGTPLAESQILLDGGEDVVFNFPFASHRPDGRIAGVQQGPDFFTEQIHILRQGDDGPQLLPLALPLDMNLQGFFDGRLIALTRKAWRMGDHNIAAGSLVSVDLDDAIGGAPERSLSVIHAASEQGAIEGVSISQSHLLISTLHQVTNRLVAAHPVRGGWRTTNIALPERGSASVTSANGWSDLALVNYESFLQPDGLYTLDDDHQLAPIRSLPERFDASKLEVEQLFATSADGTRVPYFVVRQKDAKADGTTPTLLYGYGGFEVALTPSYLSGVSKLWVEQGGAYVVANIRGGGEFGPAWHQAALKENRQRAFDDFTAVAEDLIERGITSPAHLGIRGGSNGGLLVGAMFTQRPELFDAVICAVPLLDMMRYHKLLAGASWVAEYGDPDDPLARDYIRKYSPYQNLDPERDYPEVFFYTSTRDDRVHPGHARKMTALMLSMDKPVIYYENTEGGHSAAANLKQLAYTDALQVTYLLQKLSD